MATFNVSPWVWIMGIVVVVSIVSLVGYKIVKQQATILPQTSTTSAPTATSATSPTSIPPRPIVDLDTSHWKTYTDATLGATFEYPPTWKLIYAGSTQPVTGKGTDYSLDFEDTKNRLKIYIDSISNPDNLSLADFYRKYLPGGANVYANVSFQETINPHGVRFEKVVNPYVSPDYNDSLNAVHNSKIYEITKTISVETMNGIPTNSNYHQDPIFQTAVAEYNHLINSFAFTN